MNRPCHRNRVACKAKAADARPLLIAGWAGFVVVLAAAASSLPLG